MLMNIKKWTYAVFVAASLMIVLSACGQKADSGQKASEEAIVSDELERIESAEKSDETVAAGDLGKNATKDEGATIDENAASNEAAETESEQQYHIFAGKDSLFSADVTYLEKRVRTDDETGDAYVHYLPIVCEELTEPPYFYWDNQSGISYSATDVNFELDSVVYHYFDEAIKSARDVIPLLDGYLSMETEEINVCEEDRYQKIHIQLQDITGEKYTEHRTYYLDVQAEGKAVLYEIDVDELFLEPESEAKIKEIESCFAIEIM